MNQIKGAESKTARNDSVPRPLGTGFRMTIANLVRAQVAADRFTRAVSGYHAMGPESDRDQYIKTIQRLAANLLTTRQRWRKSQIADATSYQSENRASRRQAEVAGLRRKEANLQAGGIAAILAEFGGPGWIAD